MDQTCGDSEGFSGDGARGGAMSSGPQTGPTINRKDGTARAALVVISPPPRGSTEVREVLSRVLVGGASAADGDRRR